MTGAAEALVSIPDGALVIDGDRITYCGPFDDVEAGDWEVGGFEVFDHRPGFLLPGFVDTHVHFPQTFAGDAYGGGQLLEWLDACIFPSETLLADPSFAATAAVAF